MADYATQHRALSRVWGATKKRADRLKRKYGLAYAQAEVARQARRGDGRDATALRALAKSAGLPLVKDRKTSFRSLCTEEQVEEQLKAWEQAGWVEDEDYDAVLAGTYAPFKGLKGPPAPSRTPREHSVAPAAEAATGSGGVPPAGRGEGAVARAPAVDAPGSGMGRGRNPADVLTPGSLPPVFPSSLGKRPDPPLGSRPRGARVKRAMVGGAGRFEDAEPRDGGGAVGGASAVVPPVEAPAEEPDVMAEAVAAIVARLGVSKEEALWMVGQGPKP